MYQKNKFHWTALKLTIFIILVFFIQLIFPKVTEMFVLQSSDLLSRPWILLTSIFLHGGWTHLLYNMFALFMFGSLLEKQIGSRFFLTVFFTTGIVASILASQFYSASLGASGAVYGVIGMLTILTPFTMVWAFGVPMPLIVASILWILGDVIGFTSYLQGVPGGIANAAHLGGVVVGIFVGLFAKSFLRKNKKQYRLLRKKQKREFRRRQHI